MSTTVRTAAGAGAGPAARRPANGGGPARRAVIRWAWRLFRREWRQQLLVLTLLTVAVAATIVGAAVATNTPPPANAGFGTADHSATFAGNDPHLAAEIAAIRHRFGTVDVIENQTLQVPGTVTTVQLRAQDPARAVRPADARPGERPLPVRARPGRADQRPGSQLGLATGDVWRQRQHRRRGRAPPAG